MEAKALRRISPLDTDFEDNIVSKVEKHNERYEVQFDGNYWLSIESPNFKPKAGMKARQYGSHGWGGRVRGLVIDGNIIWYRTVKQQENQLLKEKREHDRREKRDARANLAKTNSIIAGFPPEFKARIKRFRQNKDFWWQFEPYEVGVCVDAIKIAKKLKTREAIQTFYKADWKVQERLVPGLDKGRSGNSFGMSVVLAEVYVTKPELVREYHGSLAALVGSKAYAPNKYGV